MKNRNFDILSLIGRILIAILFLAGGLRRRGVEPGRPADVLSAAFPQ